MHAGTPDPSCSHATHVVTLTRSCYALTPVMVMNVESAESFATLIQLPTGLISSAAFDGQGGKKKIRRGKWNWNVLM